MENESILWDLQLVFFEKTQESIAIFDSELNFIFANRALLEVLGMSREQVIGKNLTDISPGIEDTERYAVYIEVMNTGETQVLDATTVVSSVGRFVSRIQVFKVRDGIGISALNISDLDEALDELETFIYKASHDMRAPISSILGLINIAMLDAVHHPGKYYHMIRQQTERMDRMLSQLCQTARIRKGSKVIHPINFPVFFEKLKSTLVFMEGYDQIEFIDHIHVRNTFYSDKALLTNLFLNLMDNAVKYRKTGPEQSILQIEISDYDEGVKICFKDNGTGIAPAYHHDVFRMFFRANVNSKGSGLGLYTVKHCVKKLHGSIEMESTEGVGTMFTIVLPNQHVHEPHTSVM